MTPEGRGYRVVVAAVDERASWMVAIATISASSS
jgi:hypothetical protein